MDSDCVHGVVYGDISNCVARGNVLGNYDIGGIVGFIDATITDCVNYASIKWAGGSCGSNDGFGGVAGQMLGTMKDCTNYGTVSGNIACGGVIGAHYGSKSCIDKSKIINIKNYGTVTGKQYVHKLVGGNGAYPGWD